VLRVVICAAHWRTNRKGAGRRYFELMSGVLSAHNSDNWESDPAPDLDNPTSSLCIMSSILFITFGAYTTKTTFMNRSCNLKVEEHVQQCLHCISSDLVCINDMHSIIVNPSEI
jgi:hypothetical protein